MSIAQDIAQVCENGHVVNSFSVWAASQNLDFCPICGAKTQMKCTNCNTPIQGGLRHLGLTEPGEKEPRTMFREDAKTIPAYCGKCGQKFPWAVEESVKKLSELVRQCSANELDKEEATTALERIRQLAGKPKNAEALARANEKLELVKNTIGTALELSKVAAPYIAILANHFA